MNTMHNAAPASNTFEIVNIHTSHRGVFAVAVYITKKLGWAANYGALETYNNPTRESAIASLKLSLEISNPAPSPSTAKVFACTLRCAERGASY